MIFLPNLTKILSSKMPLSDATTSKIANALRHEVLEYLMEEPEFVQYFQEKISLAICDKMGDMDEDLLIDLSMHIFNHTTIF
jgi:hypothetical protein